MTERGFGLWMVVGLMLSLGPAWPAAAPAGDKPSLPELKERFEKRYPRIKAYKDRGRIGETWEGYIAAVKGRYARKDDDKLGDLIAAENRDRTRLYKIVAEQEDTSPSRVARRNAIRNFRKAEPGHYLRDKQGHWYRKSGEDSS